MLFIDCRNDCHDLLRSHPFQQLDGLFLFAGCRFFSPLRREDCFFANTLRSVSSILDVSKLPIYRSVVARLLCPRMFLMADDSAPASLRYVGEGVTADVH